jgi:hypothetical protein
MGVMTRRAHKKWQALGALGAALALASSVVSSAAAHDLRNDSVDCTGSACQIRWEDHTRYDDARRFAIGQWNRLGRVDILPDSALTVADLEWVDFNECDVKWEAFWSTRFGADVIGFNPCTITRQRTFPPDPRAVAVHELGHALRLAHPSGECFSRHWMNHSIMYLCARCTPTSTYHHHDIGDYRAMW